VVFLIGRRTYLALLFDFYGGLLTEKQRLMFDLYYQCDLSLGEIAEEHQISRQAVYDILKRSENTLEEYESKLHLISKFQVTKEKLKKALELINDMEKEKQAYKINELNTLICSILDEG